MPGDDCQFRSGYLTGYDLIDGVYDTREVAYQLKMTSYCALFDTSSTYRNKCQATIVNSFPSLWTPTKFADGSWPQLYVVGTSWNPNSSATLTNGSTTVTGVGATGWVSTNFPSRIWFFPSTVRVPQSNSAGDPVSYSVTFVSATQLTLGSPYRSE